MTDKIRWLTGSWGPYALLALAVLALYGRTLWFGYSGHDDIQLLEQKAGELTTPANILKAFQTDVVWGHQEIYYRPVLTLSFMADAIWGGMRPFAFHAGNLLLHLLAVLLLYPFLLRLGIGPGRALVAAVFFAVHPLLAQAVGWIPGRNDSLLTALVIASFLMFTEYLERGKKRHLAGHLILFLLALLSKETAVFLPLLTLWYWAIRKAEGRLFEKAGPVLPAAGWVIAGVSYYLLRINAINTGSGVSAARFNTLAQNLTGFLSYLGKIFFPIGLSGDPIPADLTVVYGLVSLAGLAALFILAGVRDRRMFWLGLAWFVLFLVPTFLGNTSYANFAEHRMYLPLCGFLLMLAQADLRLGGQAARAAGALLTAVLLAFIVINFKHTSAYADRFRYWGSTVKNSPHSYHAHNMLGRCYAQEGMFAEAEREFLESWRLNPAHTTAYNDLGLLYLGQGKFGEAEEIYRQLLAKDPSNAGAHNNLGLLYLQQGRLEQAEQEFLVSAELNPERAAVFDNLGLVYFRKGQLAQAEKNFIRSSEMDPKDIKVNFHLASLYYTVKDYPRAITYYDKALRLGMAPDPRVEAALGPHRR
jgi:Flp pilus assembly protein TadD